MPKAVANLEGKKFDLETLPGGFVVLRKLSYGELLTRRNLGLGVNAPFRRDTEEVDFQLQMDQSASRFFEFAHMILDHNLEDENGKPLNMNSAADVQRLDPAVAQEIEEYMNDLNTMDEEAPLLAKSGSPSHTTNASSPE